MKAVNDLVKHGVPAIVNILPYQLALFISLVILLGVNSYYFMFSKPRDIVFTPGCFGLNISTEQQAICDAKEIADAKKFNDNKKIAYVVSGVMIVIISLILYKIWTILNKFANKL